MKNSCNCPECAADTVESRKDLKVFFVVLTLVFVIGEILSVWK